MDSPIGSAKPPQAVCYSELPCFSETNSPNTPSTIVEIRKRCFHPGWFDPKTQPCEAPVGNLRALRGFPTFVVQGDACVR